MNFGSLKEYFYRLYNTCLLRLLLVMGLFLLIYYLSLSGLISPYITQEELIDFLRYTYLILIVVALTIVHLVTYKRLKAYAATVGLGDKLELYYNVVKLRMRTFVVISAFTAAGLLFTGHEWFSIYFGGMLVWSMLQWPTARKVCNQLRLRGDERIMVISKGDAFKF
ncbi:MAG TPA: hypothetical protein VKQ08_02355 [Cyclobacteriaceae bacterium]|nr:hypothetical protein [Cyclobacteriaceae bacterium]